MQQLKLLGTSPEGFVRHNVLVGTFVTSQLIYISLESAFENVITMHDMSEHVIVLTHD